MTVGANAFSEGCREKLCIRAKGREVIVAIERYPLREPAVACGIHSENDGLSHEKLYFCIDSYQESIRCPAPTRA